MQDKSYFWGHYFPDDDYVKAVADFEERCRRYGIDPATAERVPVTESMEDDDDSDVHDITRANPFADLTERFQKGGWIEVATAGPEAYMRRRYGGQNGQEVVRWQKIRWLNSSKIWSLEDTGKIVIEDEMDRILAAADDLWTQH